MELDEFGCIKLWTACMREDRSSQYKYDKRKEHISDLMEMFTTNGVKQEDAEMMKKKVVEVLVTPSGMTVKDKKYKGWKEKVGQDFDDAIQLTYIRPHVKSIKAPKNTSSHNPLIMNWLKKTFGDNLNPELVLAAHVPGHTLWCQAINETKKRNTGGRL